MNTYHITEVAVYEWKAKTEEAAIKKHLGCGSVERDHHFIECSEREIKEVRP